jgi:uncharacterized protein YbaP (TraB family)
VTSKTTTVYLLGSLHVVKPDVFPLPKEIEDAFAASKKLAVEVNTEGLNQLTIVELTLKKGMYPKGKTLSKTVSKETLDLLKKYCAKKNLKLADVDPMRPWLVEMLVVAQELKGLGYSEEGIDRHFLKKAKAQKKPIMELETIGAQIDLFAQTAPDLQEKMLAGTLKEVGSLKDQIEKVIAGWKSGDGEVLNELMLRDPVKHHPESKAVMVKLFDDRNVKMVEKIEEMLKGKDTCFVIVGAGHLVGKKGIVKLLKDRKYSVDQVCRAAAKK